MSQRVDYFDTAKGILIIVVVMGHTLLYVGNAGITHYGQDMFHAVYSCFMLFYMQAFFFINGLTTNFNYSFFEFIKKKFLTLMIPCIVFSLLINLCDGQYLFNMELLHILIKHGGRGTYMWFLPALFLANITFWFFNRYVHNNFIKALAIIALAVMGGGLNEHNIGKNIWYCYHALLLIPFLWLGWFMKEYNLNGKKTIEITGIVVYFAIVIIGMIYNLNLPYLCLGINVTTVSLPIYLISAACGSVTILTLARKLRHSKTLQNLGRGSLVIYMTHIVVICEILSFTAKYWKIIDSNVIGGLLFVALMIVSIIISYGLNLLFNKRYLRILLGRI